MCDVLANVGLLKNNKLKLIGWKGILTVINLTDLGIQLNYV